MSEDKKLLDKPARVGAVVFGKGVEERLVIEYAQRAYEYHEREVRSEPSALQDILAMVGRAS